VPRRQRLDAELVRRGLARSRQQAGDLVAAGRVSVSGRTAAKPATQVELADPIVVVQSAGEEYVSRGGHKLAGALEAFADDGLTVAGRRCLDAGASTGGFTDVLLRRGAASVTAVDVGYGQLAWSLQQDPRVRVLDRTNVRHLDPQAVGPPVDLVVADLSFISLVPVLPALVRCCVEGADLVLMVKPQFEVGRDRLGSGGVVRDPALHAEAVLAVARAAQAQALAVHGVVASPLPGPSGNVEYFLWLRTGAGTSEGAVALPDEATGEIGGLDLPAAVAAAVAAGPAGAPAPPAPAEAPR
jgi:23S rRNA (cytidine1920-2'-O)/16S rRNA (cytidine1409-2'-O)-methyltransferase